MRLMRPVMPANVLGLLAATVRAGTAAGLPAGVQVTGARFQELACLTPRRRSRHGSALAEAIDPVLERSLATP